MRWTHIAGRSCCATSGACADGEVVWSWRSDAGVKLAKTLTRLADDGGNQAWSPGRSRISRKAIAQGRPDDPPVPVVLPRAFFLHADHGCGGHPAFPAPSVISRAARSDNSDASVPREHGLTPLHTSSRRRPGPITTGSRFAKATHSIASIDGPRRMGPGSRPGRPGRRSAPSQTGALPARHEVEILAARWRAVGEGLLGMPGGAPDVVADDVEQFSHLDAWFLQIVRQRG